MEIITEDYVSFEVAKLLKEKGFDEATIVFYRHNISHDKYDMVYCNEADEDMGSCMAIFKCNTDLEETYRWDASTEGYSAPTQQMACKWLREVHDIDVSIIPLRSHKEYLPRIEGDITSHDAIPCRKYEEACEIAIKYSLENLI